MITEFNGNRTQTTARMGSTLAEVMVSAVLITAMVSLISTIVVRSGRMSQQTRQAQFAMDELSNQMERITLLPVDQLEQAIKALEISDEFHSSVPDALLSGKVVRDDDSTRVVLDLDWQRNTPSLPLTLVAWVDPGLSTKSSELLEEKK